MGATPQLFDCHDGICLWAVAYLSDRASSRLHDDLEDLRHKWGQVVEPIAACNQDQYGDIELADVQLMGKVSIACQEDVELRRGKRKQLAILLARPPHLWGGFHIMSDDLSFQTPRQELGQALPRLEVIAECREGYASTDEHGVPPMISGSL